MPSEAIQIHVTFPLGRCYDIIFTKLPKLKQSKKSQETMQKKTRIVIMAAVVAMTACAVQQANTSAPCSTWVDSVLRDGEPMPDGVNAKVEELDGGVFRVTFYRGFSGRICLFPRQQLKGH